VSPVPITFACSCGRTLRVKDDHAGKWVRCPACRETAIVPEAEPEPQFEVVEDDPPPPPTRTRVKAEPATDRYDTEEDDDRPRRRRRADDRDNQEDRPRRPRKKKSRQKSEEKPGHFALERRVFNGGVAGGVLAMVVAVVWFIAGLAADRIFFYPPILFIIGLCGFFKGLAGGGDD
jgi:hypothetical protein